MLVTCHETKSNRTCMRMQRHGSDMHVHTHTHTTHAYTWMTCHELTSYVHANTYTCRRRGYTLMTCHEATEHVHATTDMTHTHTHMTCMHATIYTCSLWLVPIEYVHATRHRRTHTHTRHAHYFIRACQHVCMCTHTQLMHIRG